jgi:hypothetical protein
VPACRYPVRAPRRHDRGSAMVSLAVAAPPAPTARPSGGGGPGACTWRRLPRSVSRRDGQIGEMGRYWPRWNCVTQHPSLRLTARSPASVTTVAAATAGLPRRAGDDRRGPHRPATPPPTHRTGTNDRLWCLVDGLDTTVERATRTVAQTRTRLAGPIPDGLAGCQRPHHNASDCSHELSRHPRTQMATSAITKASGRPRQHFPNPGSRGSAAQTPDRVDGDLELPQYEHHAAGGGADDTADRRAPVACRSFWWRPRVLITAKPAAARLAPSPSGDDRECWSVQARPGR